METKQVGERLVSLCREGKNMQAIDELYSPDIVSVEAEVPQGMDKEARGIEAIKQKNKWWFENAEIHSHSAEGPFVNGDRFAVLFDYDVTSNGKRNQMREVANYDVKDGKIVREEFLS